MNRLGRNRFILSRPGRQWGLVLAGLLLSGCLACDSGPVPTPTAVLVPTVPPPQVQRPPVEVTASPTPVPPSATQMDQVAALLDRWALGDAALGQGVTSKPMSQTGAGDFIALALQRAAVLTPTAGVQIEPAILVTDSAGQARALAFAAGNGTDLLVPDQVVWGEHGAAAAILFTWRIAGRAVENRPFILLDATGKRSGPVLWTLASAPPPAWAPGGAAFAYLDGSAAGPRMVVATGAGQARASDPATNLECARCWPDGLWAPDGSRWAYTTAQTLAGATPNPLGQLTWQLVVLDAAQGQVLFDQTGQAVGVAQVVGWKDPAQVQVVVRTPLVPSAQITGTQGNWVDTSYVLRLDTTPPRLVPSGP